MKKIIISTLTLFFLSSCTKNFSKEKKVENKKNEKIENKTLVIQPEFLFEKDGCKMYKFTDEHRRVYWSNCSGRTEYKSSFKSGAVVQITDKK
ncbi:hypothetical protein [Chryseobacterium carnipullorum]|nr:hypothetical protein [Chryseobacterium carnipullorum]